MSSHTISRRQMLRASLYGAASTTLPLAPALAGEARWRNWSGLQTANPRWRLNPSSSKELIAALPVAPSPIRPIGASHSFAPLCVGEGTQVSLEDMRGLLAYNDVLHRARMRAGTSIQEAATLLAGVGQAFANQGDIDSQSLAGACGTSTHGTGRELGSFSAMVTAAQLLTPGGDILEFSERENADLLPAVACSLGCLGVITEIELQNRPSYRLKEQIRTEDLKTVIRSIDALQRNNRHFEFFVFPYSDTVIVKTLNESTAAITPPPDYDLPTDSIFHWVTRLGHGVSPLDGPLQRLLSGLMPSSERVAESHRIFPSQRNTRFNEMEYEIPIERGPDCLLEILQAVRKAGLNIMFPIEYRTVAADAAWISPFYQRPTAAISIHQWAEADHRPLFDLVEPIFRRNAGRPHWGKMHTMEAAELAGLYPRWEDFARLRAELDPQGRMLNEPLRRMLIG